MIISITNNGYIQKTPKNEFGLQKCGGKGIYKSFYSSGIKTIIEASENDTLLLFTTMGQCYKLNVHDIPSLDIEENGISLNEMFDVNDTFCSILSIRDFLVSNEADDYLVIIMTKKGKMSKQKLTDYKGILDGNYAVSLDEGDGFASVILAKENDFAFNCSIDGIGKTFTTDSVKTTSLKSRSKGVLCSYLRYPESSLVDIDVCGDSNIGYLLISSMGYLIRTKNIYYGDLKCSGGSLMNLKENDYVVFNSFADEDDDILIVTNKGYTICLNIGSLKEVNRGGRGCLCIKLSEGDKISACCKIKKSESTQNSIDLIIVGNGFDLANNYKTSCKDFIKSNHFKGLAGKNQLASRIEKECIDKNWGDVELEIANYANNHGDKYKGEIPIQFGNKFEDEYFKLKGAIDDYLASQDNHGLSNPNMLKLIDFWANRSFEDKKRIHMFSFNYMHNNLIDYIYSHLNINKESNYTKDKVSINKKMIVLGVDETNIKYINQHRFLIKYWDKKTEPYGYFSSIDKADRITIFGCSLGESDYRYYEPLFKNAKNKQYEIYCYGKNEYEQIQKRINNYVGLNKDLFYENNKIIFYDSSKNDFPRIN